METKKKASCKPPPPPKPAGYKGSPGSSLKTPKIVTSRVRVDEKIEDGSAATPGIPTTGNDVSEQVTSAKEQTRPNMSKSPSAPSDLGKKSLPPKPKTKPKPAKRKSLIQVGVKSQDANSNSLPPEHDVRLAKPPNHADINGKDGSAPKPVLRPKARQDKKDKVIEEVTKSGGVVMEPGSALSSPAQDPIKPPRKKKTRKSKQTESLCNEGSSLDGGCVMNSDQQGSSDCLVNSTSRLDSTTACELASPSSNEKRLSEIRRSPSYEAAICDEAKDTPSKANHFSEENNLQSSKSLSELASDPQSDVEVKRPRSKTVGNEDELSIIVPDLPVKKKTTPSRPNKPPVQSFPNSSPPRNTQQVKPWRKAPPVPSQDVKNVNVSLDVMVPSLYNTSHSLSEEQEDEASMEEGYLLPVGPGEADAEEGEEEQGGEYSYVQYEFGGEKMHNDTLDNTHEQSGKDKKRSSFHKIGEVFSSKSKKKTRPSSSVFYFEIDDNKSSLTKMVGSISDHNHLHQISQSSSCIMAVSADEKLSESNKAPHMTSRPSPIKSEGPKKDAYTSRPPAPLPEDAEIGSNGNDSGDTHVYTMPREPYGVGFRTMVESCESVPRPKPPPRRKSSGAAVMSAVERHTSDSEDEDDYIIPGQSLLLGKGDVKTVNEDEVKRASGDSNQGTITTPASVCLPAAPHTPCTTPQPSLHHEYDEVPFSSDLETHDKVDEQRSSLSSDDSFDYIYPDQGVVPGGPPLSDKLTSTPQPGDPPAEIPHQLSSVSDSSDSPRPYSWCGHAVWQDYVHMDSTSSEGNIYANSSLDVSHEICEPRVTRPQSHDPLGSDASQSDSEGEDNVDQEEIKLISAQKVFNVAQEIMTSERSFVQILQLLNVEFRRVINYTNQKTGSPVVPAATLDQILKYLPQLQVFNEDLLKDLKLRILNWDADPRVADIFVKKGAFLKMYTDYIREFETMCSTLDETRKKNSNFNTVVSHFEMGPKCKKLALKHYMLKPIQRIPQYRLLLQEYRKHLLPDSPDLQDTDTALAIVSEVADHANQSMKYGDNLNKLLEIQNTLIGQFEVIRPGRYLVKKGELNKLSRKEMQPRYFFLLNDVLLYTTPVAAGYRLNNVLPLHNMKVSRPNKEDFLNEFSIISTQRSFTISASTEEEKEEWLNTLEKTISENMSKRQSYTSKKMTEPSIVNIEIQSSDFKLGTKAPVWIPDVRVSMCMGCTAEFSVTFRRHHCRACGKVVCRACSDFKAPLRYLTYKPARVCSECFNKLTKEIEEQEDDGPEPPSPGDGLAVTGGGTSPFSKSNLLMRFKGMGLGSFGKGVNKKRPSVLQEVHANAEDAEMSGYLKVWKNKRWKKLWFVLKGKVLYTYKASEDTAAEESTVLLGYEVRPFLSHLEPPSSGHADTKV